MVEPALGLTQIQSMPCGGSSVPLVSTAISKPACVERDHELGVHLQERLAAGADDETRAAAVGARPPRRDRSRELVGRPELAATVAVGTDELGVAERAHRRGAVLLVPGPEVAAREAAEHGRPARVGSLALQRVEDLLDGVGHLATAASGW